MLRRYTLLAMTAFLFMHCAQEPAKIELSNPGFGMVETSIAIRAEGTDLPVLLNTDQAIKGIQFTMVWDPTLAVVGQPVLTPTNSGFTVSAKKNINGTMKVLVFSMTGDVLNTTDPHVMNIPVSILEIEATKISIDFEDVIFAGPSATSYDIPVTQARLKVTDR